MTTQIETLVAQSEAVIDGMTVEELEQMANEAQEPGASDSNVVNRPSADNPLPMTVGDMSSAGWVYVFDRRTGERSIVNRNNLGKQLQKTRPDNPDGFPIGERVFTTDPRNLPMPKRGTLLCMLHKDHPSRDEHIRMGLPICRKANLMTSIDVRRHMEHRHKSEWAAIEEVRVTAEREEERDFRRAMMGRAVQNIPVDEPDTPRVKPAKKSVVLEHCSKCGGDITGKSMRGITFARINHQKVCPEA